MQTILGIFTPFACKYSDFLQAARNCDQPTFDLLMTVSDVLFPAPTTKINPKPLLLTFPCHHIKQGHIHLTKPTQRFVARDFRTNQPASQPAKLTSRPRSSWIVW